MGPISVAESRFKIYRMDSPIKELVDIWHFIGRDNWRDFRANIRRLNAQGAREIEIQKQAAQYYERKRQEELETVLKAERN